jgi:serine/threonine protein kinase
MVRTLGAGDVINGFCLIEPLHRGGLGALWRVTRPDIDLPIVIKLPLLPPGDDLLAIVSYETEQMILPRLSGTHVPHFVAAGDFDGPFIVMELIRGQSLKERLNDLPLASDEVASLGARIADAIGELHGQRVIHLDIKPSNIMVRDNGDVVLLDFGLSRHLDLPDLPAEELDGPLGTNSYIAPEQLLGIRDDTRSDLFGLGVVLYFLATGQRPFGEPRTVAQWRQRLYVAPAPPCYWRSEIPTWLQEIILHCLEVDPRDRYQSAAHLAFDLRHPELVPLTERATRTRGNRLLPILRLWITQARTRIAMLPAPRTAAAEGSIIMAAVDLSEEYEQLSRALAKAVARLLASEPNARLACVNIFKLARVMPDKYEDEEGRNLHLLRLSQLKHWAAPLQHLPNQITYHVIEAFDPAAALIDFARRNKVHHLVMGARSSAPLRRYLGSVSSKIIAEAPCTATVVRI